MTEEKQSQGAPTTNQSARETCPHGCGSTNGHSAVRDGAIYHVGVSCRQCGWSSDKNPRVYTLAEAVDEALAASRAIVDLKRLEGEGYAVTGIVVRYSEQLRQEAANWDAEQARFRRARRAFARLDGLGYTAEAQPPLPPARSSEGQQESAPPAPGCEGLDG